MPEGTYEKGLAGEAQAEAYLQSRGMVPLMRRYRSPFGEIDLIMLDGDVLAFVEVKLRTRGGTEAGQAAVTPLKRRRMVEAARCYLGAHPEHAGRCVRFDVVTVTAEGVRHVPDAFSGCEW